MLGIGGFHPINRLRLPTGRLLERLVAGDLIDHSDLIDKLLNHNEEQDAIPAFYEVIDEN